MTSEGGREHFMVMVSPTRDEAADAVFRAIPPVTSKAPRQPISRSEIGLLRSVGGLVSTTPESRGDQPVLGVVR